MSAIVFIPLTQGKVAVIDFEDFEKVRGFNWCAAKSGRVYYARRRRLISDGPGPGHISLHEVLLVASPPLIVDHKDGDGLNNTKSNLRAVSRAGNKRGFVRKQTGATGRFRGVCWNKLRNKWRARIRYEGKLIHLGHFKSEEDAARAYNKKASEFFYPESLHSI